jgi:hypothetical protein
MFQFFKTPFYTGTFSLDIKVNERKKQILKFTYLLDSSSEIQRIWRRAFHIIFHCGIAEIVFRLKRLPRYQTLIALCIIRNTVRLPSNEVWYGKEEEENWWPIPIIITTQIVDALDQWLRTRCMSEHRGSMSLTRVARKNVKRKGDE